MQKCISNFFSRPNRPKKSFVQTLPMGLCKQAFRGRNRWSLTCGCTWLRWRISGCTYDLRNRTQSVSGHNSWLVTVKGGRLQIRCATKGFGGEGGAGDFRVARGVAIAIGFQQRNHQRGTALCGIPGAAGEGVASAIGFWRWRRVARYVLWKILGLIET